MKNNDVISEEIKLSKIELEAFKLTLRGDLIIPDEEGNRGQSGTELST